MEDISYVAIHLNVLITNTSKDINKEIHKPSSDDPALLSEWD